MWYIVAKSFNPRARVGRDIWDRGYIPHSLCFNPRARVGRDSISALKLAIKLSFQSTRPRGARHNNAFFGIADLVGFNPRARVGRDMLMTRWQKAV